jgi:hypothetical protein
MNRAPIYALALLAGPALGQPPDALQVFDDALFAGVALDRCHFALGWQPSQARLGEIGKAAYQQLLGERTASHPGDRENAGWANFELAKRMERVAREAAATIHDLGCNQIEARARRAAELMR